MISAVFTVFLAASAASAQTAPSLLIDPWPADVIAQTYDQVLVLSTGDVEQDGSDAGVFAWDSFGRVKFDRADAQPGEVVGYRFLNLDVTADRNDLNGTYNDLAIAGGFQLGAWGEWSVAAIAGVGTANDNHWQHGDSYYGLGVLHASRKLGDGEQLHVGVSYDGNRALLPDVPLPYVSYVNATDASLVWVLGLPVSGVTWKPDDRWTLALRYTVPTNLTANAAFALSDALSLFAAYESKLDAFHEHDAANDHRRLFYERDLVTAGVRYVHRLADVSLGVGYAFEQEFSRGWDTRDTDTVADIDGVPLVMLTVRGTF